MSDETVTLSDIDARLKDNQKLIDQASSSATTATVSHALPSWWNVQNAMTISASVLVFGFLVLVLASLYMKKASESQIRIFAIMLIIVMAVFLIVAGYSDTQIAPAIGLLGTIAGYLLGKDASVQTTTTPKNTTSGDASNLPKSVEHTT